MDATKHAHLLEYQKLKDEQARRIHFRDNLRYVTVAAVGVVAAQAGRSTRELWLVIPWICAVCGCNYLANGASVKRIRQYIEERLSEMLSPSAQGHRPFAWETVSRTDISRQVRQLIVDQITFVLPGVVALVIFSLTEKTSGLLWPLVGAEALLCLGIGVEIYKDADERARACLRKAPAVLARRLLERRSRSSPAGRRELGGDLAEPRSTSPRPIRVAATAFLAHSPLRSLRGTAPRSETTGAVGVAAARLDA